jgi:enoyl-[acyl-carrier protein] reductase I
LIQTDAAFGLGLSTTGEIIHVDAGFHMMGLPDGDEG